MTWFDIVKAKRKLLGPLVKEIVKEIIEREKNIVLSDTILNEVLSKYIQAMPHQKAGLSVRFKNNLAGLKQIVHGYTNYPSILHRGIVTYFVDIDTLEKFRTDNNIRPDMKIWSAKIPKIKRVGEKDE
tara:strand:- start:1670 stop:2053 length:384 start_codon:yes stop_codon:yes gene_type:complete